MSSDRFAKTARARKHDYHLLNDGSDEEADITDRMEESQSKRSQIVPSIENQSIEYTI